MLPFKIVSQSSFGQPTYDKELFVVVQAVKKSKHYQPLQFLQSQSKMQQVRHYNWMELLQQFHLLIKYKKGATKNLPDMLSQPSLKKIAAICMLMQYQSFTHDLLSEDYQRDDDFKGTYQQLKERLVADLEGNEYNLQNGPLYKLRQVMHTTGYQNSVDERSSYFQDSRAFWHQKDGGKSVEVCLFAKDARESGEICQGLCFSQH